MYFPINFCSVVIKNYILHNKILILCTSLRKCFTWIVIHSCYSRRIYISATGAEKSVHAKTIFLVQGEECLAGIIIVAVGGSHKYGWAFRTCAGARETRMAPGGLHLEPHNPILSHALASTNVRARKYLYSFRFFYL